MKGKELKAALRAISVVLREPRLNPGYRDQLLQVRRELEKFARSGKTDRRRMCRIVERVATILLHIVED